MDAGARMRLLPSRLAEAEERGSQPVLVCHFEERLRTVREALAPARDPIEVRDRSAFFELTTASSARPLALLASVIADVRMTYRAVERPLHFLVVERHLLATHDDAVVDAVKDLGSQHQIAFLCALDDELFMRFGGTKLQDMMRQLGMQPDEAMEHRFVDGAIRNAQRKVARRKPGNQYAASAAEWVKRNL